MTETYPAPDGQVRTVAVKVKEKIYTRPVVRLIPLPWMGEEDVCTPGSLSGDRQLGAAMYQKD